MSLPAHILAALSGRIHARPVASVTPVRDRAPVFAPSQQSTPRASRLVDVIDASEELESHDCPMLVQGEDFAICPDNLS